MTGKKVLTAVDLVGIQRFIFSSNRLRDVTGASHLVNLATPRQVDQAEKGRQAIATKGALAACGAVHAVIVSGGGNAVLEFTGENALEEAKTFAARYSRWLIEEAPGLDAVIEHEPYEEGFAEALSNLLEKTARAKHQREPSIPLLGLSVTAACRETGLPANEPSADGDPIAASVDRIRKAASKAQDYWRDLLLPDRTIGENRFPVFPMELDDMGRTEGQTSLIGVVHIDGNGVGRKIVQWLQQAGDANDDEVKEQYKQWSRAIDALGTKLLKTVVERVVARVQSKPKRVELQGWPEWLSFRLQSDRDDVFLPLRPVILGGDDLTFLCDGRIALDLAVAALEAFRADNRIAHLGDIGACAGVAIVHAHAPILRAWSLAEELCRSAKRKVHDSGRTGFALDWHIGLPAPGQSIRSVRESQYQAGDRRLTCRPLLLGDLRPPETESWKWMEEEMLADGGDTSKSLRGKAWRDHKNKVKQLAPLLRIGPAEIEDTLDAWRVVDDRLGLPHDIEDGFIGNAKTPLLDALELVDIHLSLESAP